MQRNKENTCLAVLDMSDTIPYKSTRQEHCELKKGMKDQSTLDTWHTPYRAPNIALNTTLRDVYSVVGKIHKAPDILGDAPDAPPNRVLREVAKPLKRGNNSTSDYDATPDITSDTLSSTNSNV